MSQQIATIDSWNLYGHKDTDAVTVRDIDLATRAGMARPRDISRVIKSATADGLISALSDRADLNASFVIEVPEENVGGNGRRQLVTRRYLSEAAAVHVLLRLRTQQALCVQKDVVQVFMKARHGALVPSQRDPDVAAELRDLAARIAPLEDIPELLNKLHDAMVLPDRRLVRDSYFHQTAFRRALAEACEVEARWQSVRQSRRLIPNQVRPGIARKIEAASRIGHLDDLRLDHWEAALVILEKVRHDANEEITNFPATYGGPS